MLIVYDSMTGNVQRFIDKLGMRNIKIYDGLVVNEPFVLVTYTFKFGEIPDSVNKFLKNNFKMLKGVASSGNRNWGHLFCRAAHTISDTYGIPLILKFELGGTKEDLEKFKQGVLSIEHS